MNLQAPFPWFGGKSQVAALVWERFGEVPNYVEPFLGSGAVLLARPTKPGIETVNDKDGFVSNFWRAVQADPRAVAKWADWPVNENDLHARHVWLRERREELSRRLEGDPDYFDAQIAGWWVWGICCWIGGGWCGPNTVGPWGIREKQLVHLGDAGRGVNRKRPHLGNGRGVTRKRPHLGDAGQGVNRQRGILEWFEQLQTRLARVRVCCGDWSRICGPTPTYLQGLTAIFLDPPYSAVANRDEHIYTSEDLAVAHEARAWAVSNGENPLLRIALCGYEGEHDMPDSWKCLAWKAHGGYAFLGDGQGRKNSARERIWFSPHCRKPQQGALFPQETRVQKELCELLALRGSGHPEQRGIEQGIEDWIWEDCLRIQEREAVNYREEGKDAGNSGGGAGAIGISCLCLRCR